MKYKLGLKPVKAQPRLRLVDFLVKSDLPSVADLKFPLGHADEIQPEMFMNDQIGDCAIAGSIEEIRLANALRGVTVNFTDETAVQNYSDITGYNPNEPSSDGGTDVHQLYEYRKTTGIVDADGNRHKILAYAGLTPGDWDELLIALSLFDMVGIGVNCPDYLDSQFDAGQPWHLVHGRHPIEGGHYIPLVGANSATEGDAYTWARKQGITAPFYNAMNIVAVVALTAELFANDKSPEGLNMEKLAAELPELNTGTVQSKAPRSKRRTPDTVAKEIIGDDKSAA